MEKNDEAIKVYNQALEIEKNSYSYRGLAEVYSDINDYKNSIDFYKKSLEYDKDPIFRKGIINELLALREKARKNKKFEEIKFIDILLSEY